MSDIHRRLKKIEDSIALPSTVNRCNSCGLHDCWKRGDEMKCSVCGPVKFRMDLANEEGSKRELFKCEECGFEEQILLIDLGGERWNEVLMDLGSERWTEDD